MELSATENVIKEIREVVGIRRYSGVRGRSVQCEA